MPLTKRARPATPTRLDEKNTGDSFRSHLYHVEEPDMFLIVDPDAKPTTCDWVIVSQAGDDIIIAPYEGQEYICVVRVLEFYQLTQSEQWTPRIHCDWTQ